MYVFRETLQPVAAMIAGLELDEYGKVEADRPRIEQRDPSLDDPRCLQFLNAAPAGRLREMHAIRDLGDRDGRIFLKDGEDHEVGTIHPFFSRELEQYCALTLRSEEHTSELSH